MRWRLCDKPLANHANDICAYRRARSRQELQEILTCVPRRTRQQVLCRHQGTVPKLPRSRQHAGTRLTRLLQGIVYDVTGNKAYQPGGSYNGMFTAPLLST